MVDLDIFVVVQQVFTLAVFWLGTLWLAFSILKLCRKCCGWEDSFVVGQNSLCLSFNFVPRQKALLSNSVLCGCVDLGTFVFAKKNFGLSLICLCLLWFFRWMTFSVLCLVDLKF